MSYDDISAEKLETMIRERKRYIERVVIFAEKIVKEIGGVIERRIENSYAHIVMELKDFNGEFSFSVSSGEGMMGGNTIKVWHHPGVRFAGIKRMPEPVMSVWYQTSLNECRVDIFDKNSAWQSSLDYIIVHKKEIIEREKEKNKQKAKEKREQLRLEREERQRRAELIKEAERLRL